jgi:hypothetical protein
MAQGNDIQPFNEWLSEQRNGVLAVELAEGLREVVEGVMALGKVGELTLKVKVKPSTKGALDSVLISDMVTVKPPIGERPESFFFTDHDGNLRRATPDRQMSIGELLEPKTPVATDISQLKEV